ncbi:MAG TPA: hypothetical protein VGM79_30285 [Streptosporangiaceae bacterium]
MGGAPGAARAAQGLTALTAPGKATTPAGGGLTRPPPAYFSQWGSLAANRCRIRDGGDPSGRVDWAALGFGSAAEYRRWTDHACGVACLQSLLHAAGREVPPMARLIDELAGAGAFQVRDDAITGLIYEPCVRWARDRWQLAGVTVPGLSAGQLHGHVAAGGMAIASVTPEIRRPRDEPARRGGHLVLVFGADDRGLTFHNPSGLAAPDSFDGTETAVSAVLPVSRFDRYFARRGMLFAGA